VAQLCPRALNHLELKSTTDSQSTSVLVPGIHLGPVTNFSFFLKLRVCYFVEPYLTSGRVCNLLLLLFLASAVPYGSQSLLTQDHILLSQFLRLPQPGRPGLRIYIPQEKGGPDIPPGTRFPFRRLLLLVRLRWRHSVPPPHGTLSHLKLKLNYDRQSVGQPSLVSGTHSARTQQKTPLRTIPLVFYIVTIDAGHGDHHSQWHFHSLRGMMYSIVTSQ
jgi:hypothetical protein